MDVARGVSAALMIFVNNSDGAVPWWLPSAAWNGLHLADVVMPAFLVCSYGAAPVATELAPISALSASNIRRMGITDNEYCQHICCAVRDAPATQ